MKLFLTVLILCFTNQLFAKTYEIQSYAMGAHRILQVHNLNVVGSIVNKQNPFFNVATDFLLEITGQVNGSDYCPADELVATKEISLEGRGDKEVINIKIGFIESAGQNDQAGLALSSGACTSGTYGDFRLKILTQVNSVGSEDTIKQWKYRIPTRTGEVVYLVTYDLVKNQWSYKQQ